MAETNQSLPHPTDGSGSLFEARIEQVIQSADLGNAWDLVAREHRWLDPQQGNEAFIDLVLKHGISRAVVECKSAIDANWIFLVPNESEPTWRARSKWTYAVTPKDRFTDWHDFGLTPRSPESAFCVVRGGAQNDAPMLDRLASLVVRSVDSLASEELSYTARSGGEARVYVPLIVTDAALQVCHLDAAMLHLSAGRIDDADFEEVPCVRFRKDLSSSTPAPGSDKDSAAANPSNERTVFVVNSRTLPEVLAQWDLPYEFNPTWPWEHLD